MTGQDNKKIRMGMWLDKILKNLTDIETKFKAGEISYAELRIELSEQYRLINLLRDTMTGRTILKGVSIS